MSGRHFQDEPRSRRRRRESSRDRHGGGGGGGGVRLREAAPAAPRRRSRSPRVQRSPSPPLPVPTGAGAPRRRTDGENESSDDSSSRQRNKLSRNVGFDRQQRDAENAAKVAEQLEKINAQRTMLQPVFAENPEVEVFLKAHPEIEPRATAQLRAMPHEQARMVITGPLDRARNKTAVILARIKNLSMGMNPTGVGPGVGAPGLGMATGVSGVQAQPAVASAPATTTGGDSMDELMAKLNADLAKEQPRPEPQRKAARVTAEELSRAYTGRISAEPVPDGGAPAGRSSGERREEAGRGGPPADIPIELPPEPASKGASSSRTPAEKAAAPSKPKGVMPRPFSSNPFHRRKASPPKKKEVEHLEPVPVPPVAEAAVSRPILGDYAPAAPALSDLPNGMMAGMPDGMPALPDAMDVWANTMAGSWEQQAARPPADLEADARFRMMAAKFRADVQQWKEASGVEEDSWHGPGTKELPPNPDGPVKPGPITPGPIQGKGAGKDAGGSLPWSKGKDKGEGSPPGLKGPAWTKGKDKGEKGCSKGEALAQANSKAAAMAPIAEEMKGKGKGKGKGGEGKGGEDRFGGKGGEDWFVGPAAEPTAAEPEAPAAEAAAVEAPAAEPEAEPKPKPTEPKSSDIPSFASILEKMRALKNKPTSAPPAKEAAGDQGSAEAGAKAAPLDMPSFSAETPTLDSILEKMRTLKEKRPAVDPEPGADDVPAGAGQPSEPAPQPEPAAAPAAAPPGLGSLSPAAAPPGLGLTGTLAALARQVGMVAGEADAQEPEAAAPVAALPAAAAPAAGAVADEGDANSPELWAQAEQARAAAAATGAAALPQGAAAPLVDPAAEAAMAAAAATAGVVDPNVDTAEAARNKQYEAYWIQCQQAAHQALFASSGSLFGGGGSNPWDQASAGDDRSGGGYSSSRTLMHDPNSRPGDWRCPQCGDLQFARNMACRQCGAKRPGEMDLLLQDPNVPANLQALISAHHKQLQQEHEEKEALREARGKGRGKKGYKGKDWD